MPLGWFFKAVDWRWLECIQLYYLSCYIQLPAIHKPAWTLGAPAGLCALQGSSPGRSDKHAGYIGLPSIPRHSDIRSRRLIRRDSPLPFWSAAPPGLSQSCTASVSILVRLSLSPQYTRNWCHGAGCHEANTGIQHTAETCWNHEQGTISAWACAEALLDTWGNHRLVSAGRAHVLQPHQGLPTASHHTLAAFERLSPTSGSWRASEGHFSTLDSVLGDWCRCLSFLLAPALSISTNSFSFSGCATDWWTYFGHSQFWKMQDATATAVVLVVPYHTIPLRCF